jgi:carbonic anhydrase/acetyltransferase-like protein (isoleucine patch superfamily)
LPEDSVPQPPFPDLFCLGYRDRQPEFLSAPRRAAAVATVCGRVRIGASAQLCAGSVIRGDGQDIATGADFFLGERSTLHAADPAGPTVIGAAVTVGANCALRSCRIGDRVVIEHGVVVLEGARVGAGSAFEHSCLIPAGAELPGGYLYRGSPAVPVRVLEAGELALLRGRVRNAPAREGPPPRPGGRAGLSWAGFVAPTAQVDGSLHLASDASVWFGAHLDGGHHGIHVGEGSNVQDNCTVYAMSSALRIGAGVTVGHNVSLQDCRIGDHALVGMASFIAAGTVVESDVMLAAGSVTLPRQVLRGGWLWGGRPARALEPMTAERRALVEQSARAYRAYVDGFRQSIAEYADLR